MKTKQAASTRESKIRDGIRSHLPIALIKARLFKEEHAETYKERKSISASVYRVLKALAAKKEQEHGLPCGTLKTPGCRRKKTLPNTTPVTVNKYALHQKKDGDEESSSDLSLESAEPQSEEFQPKSPISASEQPLQINDDAKQKLEDAI